MVETVLVIGGGIGGMSTALALTQRGVTVTLIDADPNWRVYGAGITITGMSLRAFDDLGVLDEIRERGFVHDGMRPMKFTGEPLGPALRAPPGSPPVMHGGGIMRPVLHDILSKRVRAADIDVRLGITAETLEQDESGVDVTFSDGTQAHYDLVVGADGIFSKTREMIFPDAPKPQFTDQGCWRIVAKRPPEVDRAEIYFGGPMKIGMSPISQDEMYVFLLEHVPGNPWFAPETYVEHLTEMMAPFGGNVTAVRESLGEDSQIVYRPLEWLLLPDPWYKGRVVLIGDAAHATTPHMASGAGLAVEDGLALAEELAKTDDVPAALRSFMDRRFERAKLVVETSVKSGELEIAGQQQNSMLASATKALAAPY
ncbi:2-polyprenyl-6-methoxyphenol hydroxylase-like FAD-dependent oxidoreductase [Sphingomonas vulcanisoli]|uniref:2-polyprenyl-6-methoxyphenol hydroxylase-like FAD-dependent oxidoreductase n=1 Tax=Sphingomonas vulcanisoli TaxID=1658060 RepID=A0ABX0TT37_9SPHN|nr:FAD-dependent oxidoreductase [Sphingomonas vulcanisoli]NIJ07309.1 2-polyprenyl-6-methoxyphenol hydroxylase-like FAD-dependent oxidoreductase [Sphingomonas vulcanisoli]